MSSFCSTIVALLMLTRLIACDELKCSFYSFRDGYNCKAETELAVKNTEITSVVGSHIGGKGDVDVEVFYIPFDRNMKYLPLKVCLAFKNLKKFDSYARSLIELKRNIFEKCTKVTEIKFEQVAAKTLDDDLQ